MANSKIIDEIFPKSEIEMGLRKSWRKMEATEKLKTERSKDDEAWIVVPGNLWGPHYPRIPSGYSITRRPGR